MGLIPNPWILLAFALALIGVGMYEHSEGVDDGIAQQKVTDQGEFDTINKTLAKNKADAAEILRKKQAENVALMSERDALKTTLEQQRQAHEKENLNLRTQYASLKLRFTVASDGRSGVSGGSPATTASGAPGAASPGIVVELPDTIAADLRQLTFDADQLRTAYGVCYGYATQVR